MHARRLHRKGRRAKGDEGARSRTRLVGEAFVAKADVRSGATSEDVVRASEEDLAELSRLLNERLKGLFPGDASGWYKVRAVGRRCELWAGGESCGQEVRAVGRR